MDDEPRQPDPPKSPKRQFLGTGAVIGLALGFLFGIVKTMVVNGADGPGRAIGGACFYGQFGCVIGILIGWAVSSARGTK